MSTIIEAADSFSRPNLQLNWPFDPLEVGSYGVAMVDPPWTWKSYSNKGLEKSPQSHYDCMTLDDIKSLPVAELASKEGMWIWLWATAPMYDQARECLDAWGACVAPGTRILTADMRWVGAETLEVGDGLLAFDEFPTRFGRRFYRWSTVTSTGLASLPSYRITFSDGRQIVCSDEHAWLMRTSDNGPERVLRWIKTRELAKHMSHHARKRPLCMPQIAPVGELDASFRGGFLSAAFDSEGHISRDKPRLVFAQRDNKLLERVQAYLAEKAMAFTMYEYASNPVSHLALTGGLQETMRFLVEHQPPRLLNNWQSFEALPCLYNMQDLAIEAVEFVGDREVVTLTTSSGTYISEGLPSHNTYSTQGVWVKTTKDNKGLAFGTGHVLRNCHEPFLIGRIGKPKVCSKSIRSTIMAPRREHSQKPDEAYRIAEILFGEVRRADVFSRQSRPGWDGWGLEATKFDPPALLQTSVA